MNPPNKNEDLFSKEFYPRMVLISQCQSADSYSRGYE